MIATIVIPGQTIVVGNNSVSWDHPNRDKILEALKEERYDDIPDLMSTEKAFNAFAKGTLFVENGRVVLDGEPVDELLTSRILAMMNFGLNVGPLAAFIRRSRKNTSFRVQQELYGFIEYGELPITEDGCFLARKFTTADFTPPIMRSSDISWAPGQTVSMARQGVDDDPSRTCSYGLHVYSKEYAKQFW